jgi:trimeric autotransporter adhesin
MHRTSRAYVIPAENRPRRNCIVAGPLALMAALFSLVCAPFLKAQTAAVTFNPAINTVAGTGFTPAMSLPDSGNGGWGACAELGVPNGVVLDPFGNLYIADSPNNVVREVNAATGVITVFAGSSKGSAGYGGDGGKASSATLSYPFGLALDSSNNLYIADSGNCLIREVNSSTGIISTVAGFVTPVLSALCGYTGDGGLATGAQLNAPFAIAVDSAGDLYIADTANQRVREVNAATGIISTVAGNGFVNSFGEGGYSGDGGPATLAELNLPTGVAVNSAGNLYISDGSNFRVRQVNLTSGTIDTVAGNGTKGFSGDGGPATAAELNSLLGVALDNLGNLYIADNGNSRVREVNAATSVINTVAGGGNGATVGDGGSPTSAQLAPAGMAFDQANNLYVADNLKRIRQVGPSSTEAFPVTELGSVSPPQSVLVNVNSNLTISSISVPLSAGGVQEFPIGSILGCTINGVNMIPAGATCTLSVSFQPAYPGLRKAPLVVQTSAGTFQFGLQGMGQGPLVTVSPGIITTVAGTGDFGYSGNGGPAVKAKLNIPSAVIFDNAGNLYITDADNNVVRQVNASTGVIDTVAGSGTDGYFGDSGTATSAALSTPYGLALDAAGNMFIADSGNNAIRMVNGGSGIINTMAGNGAEGFSGDGGPATSGELNWPLDIELDESGDWFIADFGNQRVRSVRAATGIIGTFTGGGTLCSLKTDAVGDNCPLNAVIMTGPSGISADNACNAYIADKADNRIRYVEQGADLMQVNQPPPPVDIGSLVTTIIGDGNQGYFGDGGPGTSAELNDPWRVILDPAGDFYVADTLNNVVRTLNSSSLLMSTLAGNGTCCYGGDGGPASGARLNSPEGIGFDPLGNLYIADSYNFRVRQVSAAGAPVVFPPTAVSAVTSAQVITLTNIGNDVLNLSSLLTSTTNFTVDPVVTTCLVSIPSLSPGGQCVIGIDFNPQTAGTLTDTLVISDNSLNNMNAFQQVQLSGIGGAVITAATATSISGPSVGTYGVPITMSASVSSSSGGTPAGTVAFMDGPNVIGTAILSSGTASISVNSLSPGTHSIVASYQGAPNFNASTSGALGITIYAQQLYIRAMGAPPPIYPAGQGTVQLVVSASGPVAAVTLSCSGLPVGATCTFSPATVTNLPTTVVMTITASTMVAGMHGGPNHSVSEKLLAGAHLATYSLALLLPGIWFIPGAYSFRRRLKATWLFCGLVVLFCLSFAGCSGHTSSSRVQQVFTVNVTATANGATQGSTNIQVTII